MAVVTLNGDPRSSRPTFYESRRFVFKSDWERNSKEEGENTHDEKRLTPRPETEGQALPPPAHLRTPLQGRPFPLLRIGCIGVLPGLAGGADSLRGDPSDGMSQETGGNPIR